MSRKKKILFYPFESIHENGPFIRISKDMFNSKAWKELSLRQQGLSLHRKAKVTKHKTHDTNQYDISIPKKEASLLYGDLKTFRKDLDELISKGFIKQVVSGWNTRTANIYGFSDKWKHYGTEGFKIPDTDRRYIPIKSQKNR